MQIAFIVAAANNGVIGNENRLLWRLPEDLKHFKKMTLGKAVIMGRKTFDSIGKALPERKNIVLSRHKLNLPEGVMQATTVDEALQIAQCHAEQNQQDEVMVIGGEQIYRLFMPLATRLYLTRVDATVDGDAFFEYEKAQWQLKQECSYTKDDKNPYDYAFCVLERKQREG